VPAEVQHVGQQEDCRDVDDQVDRDLGVCVEHLDAFQVVHFLPAILRRNEVLSCDVGFVRLCRRTPRRAASRSRPKIRITDRKAGVFTASRSFLPTPRALRIACADGP
jgi:hypothetical protein